MCIITLPFYITGKGLDTGLDKTNSLVDSTMVPDSDMGSGIMAEDLNTDTQIFVMKISSLGMALFLDQKYFYSLHQFVVNLHCFKPILAVLHCYKPILAVLHCYKPILAVLHCYKPILTVLHCYV